MAARIITFLLILLGNLVIGAAMLFFLVLGLNGFTEREANYAFGIFIGGAFLVSILTATAGVFPVEFLIKKDWHALLAVAVSVSGFIVLGFILKIVILLIGIFVADFIRTSR